MERNEKPENGLNGIKHWRKDLLAGLVVAMLSMSFLGVARASGLSEAAGLLSLIVSGFVASIIASLQKGKGPYLTIAGPAAGLATVTMDAVTRLGHGNALNAIPMLCALVIITGLVQLVFVWTSFARWLANMFPVTVAHAMLAAIGAIIIAKQLASFTGESFHGHEFWTLVWEAPAHFAHLHVKVFGLGVCCLAITFILNAIKTPWVQKVPAPVVAVLFGMIGGKVLHLEPKYLVNIPSAKTLFAGIRMPDFVGLTHEPALDVFKMLSGFVIISVVEGLATAKGIDAKDPFGRTSDPNRTLLGIGFANMASGFVCGLPIICGVVKSTGNIQAGGRTQWSAFYSATFLTLGLVFARSIFNAIPVVTLASVLVFIGYRLCGPKVWGHVTHIGREQLIVFAVTVIATVSTDIMIGIGVGLLAELIVATYYAVKVVQTMDPVSGPSIPQLMVQFFKSPVAEAWHEGDVYHLRLQGPLVCFNSGHLSTALQGLRPETTHVQFHLDDATQVDHTVVDRLSRLEAELRASGRQAQGLNEGLDSMVRLSLDPGAVRIRSSVPPPPPSPTFM